MTVTAAAMLEHSGQAFGVMELLKQAGQHRSSRDGRPDVIGFAPASCFLKSGPFEVKKLGNEHDKVR